MKFLKEMNSQSIISERYKRMGKKELEERVRWIKNKFGKRLFIPGHARIALNRMLDMS